jgi:hypothetical protein
MAIQRCRLRFAPKAPSDIRANPVLACPLTKEQFRLHSAAIAKGGV